MTTTATSTRSRRRAATTTTAATTTVDQYDHAAAATYLMKHAGTTALAVLDGRPSNQPIGCITETDIAEAMAQGKDLNEIRIRDLMAHGHAPYARLSAFPHLPADIQRALADFDERVADGRLAMAADEHPAIPAAAEAWISDFLHSHIPTEI